MDNRTTVTILKARFDELIRAESKVYAMRAAITTLLEAVEFEKPITSKRDDKRGAVVFVIGGEKMR